MNRTLICFALAAVLFWGCHESLADKAARQCREFTERNCPQQLQNGMIYDSLTFDRQSLTIHYWYTITGPGDNAELISRQRQKLRSTLLESIKSDVQSVKYKEAGFAFAVTCHSGKAPNQVLLDERFTEKEYEF